MPAYLIQGVVYGFAAAAQPGPFQTLQLLSALALGGFGLYRIGMGVWVYWRP